MPTDGDVGQNGLRQSLDSLIAQESRLEETRVLFSAEEEDYLEAPTIIGQLHSLVTGQREALQAHVQGLGEKDIPSIGPPISAAFESAPETQSGTQAKESFALLSAVATAFTKTALGYSVLHALAHRSYDIATADLADRHRRNYLLAVQTIHQAVGDVAVQELQEAGHACRCQCPACGPGVCICWHVHAGADVTGPTSTEGIVVRAPPAESNAERAGLRHGDVVLAVDGQEVRSYEDMRDGMGAHEPGEEVKLRVRRRTGGPEELIVAR